MKTIVQQVKFNAAPERLYDIYIDSKKHGAAIGSTAKVGRRPGSDCTAWDGFITGNLLAAVPKSLIAQTWRASDWPSDDPDSTFVLHFEKTEGGSLLTLVHAGVPDDERDALVDGWRENYWRPWKDYLGER